MKRISILSTFVVAIAAALGPALAGGCAPKAGSPTSAGALKDTVTFKVDGMACPNCAAHIAEELRAVPGVRSANVDFATKTATVALDPTNPASMSDLEATVAKWKKEHFAAEEDPECLDPAKRAEIKAGGAG